MLNLLCQFLSFMIPVRAGEITKSAYLTSQFDLPLGKSLIWVFVDRFFDFWVILFLIAALSPAKIISVEIDKTGKRAKVMVEEKEAPLAIGKGGINVNLASRLTEFEIDIVQTKTKESVTAPEVTPENKVSEEKPKI